MTGTATCQLFQFRLRTLLLATTVLCLFTPWIANDWIRKTHERRIWSEYFGAMQTRNQSIKAWRSAQNANDSGAALVAQDLFNIANKKFDLAYSEIQEFYDFTLNPDGTVSQNVDKITAATRKLKPTQSQAVE